LAASSLRIRHAARDAGIDLEWIEGGVVAPSGPSSRSGQASRIGNGRELDTAFLQFIERWNRGTRSTGEDREEYLLVIARNVGA
jgi:hypothetical protein